MHKWCILKQPFLKLVTRGAIEPPASWMAAFTMLEHFVETQPVATKKIIFLDELPWMDTPRSNFLMAFENFWNSFCAKREDMIVVICGSAASWMIKNIMKNKGGLHNRVTEKINLQPFTLKEIELFLKAKYINWTRYDMAQLYMVTGGVPFYIDQVQKGENIVQFIDRACFTENGALIEEFDELFASLFNRSNQHYIIIETLAKVKTGLQRDRLLELSGLQTGGGFTRTMDELLASGFITKQLPFGSTTNGSIYRLTDPFTLFYLKFMNRSKAKGEGSWLNKATTQSWVSWAGLAFENLCMQHIAEIKRALHLTAIYTEVSSWRGSYNGDHAQVDVLIERADRVIHVCEAKFSKAAFTMDKKYADELRNKLNIFSMQKNSKRKNLFLTMLTTYGVTNNEYKKELVQNEVTMDDLFI